MGNCVSVSDMITLRDLVNHPRESHDALTAAEITEGDQSGQRLDCDASQSGISGTIAVSGALPSFTRINVRRRLLSHEGENRGRRSDHLLPLTI